MSFVASLEPQALWRHFDRILTIPRGSKEEDRVRDYVLEVASRCGLEHRRDAAGNVVVRKPASAGRESDAPTVLQAHLDMVNEKNADVEHDFARDPIRPRQDGEWLVATGTTLGADNGIGVAALLALAEADDLDHGPLELLFTIDEETGLTGAMQLDGELLQGRRLINLDSEEEAAICVGCAGGGQSTLLLPLTLARPDTGTSALALSLKGLRGGHSGLDIRLQRGNAIKLLARLLHAAAHAMPLRLAAFQGGNKHNAIPREASAVVLVGSDTVARCRAALAAELDAIRLEYAVADPVIELAVTDATQPAQAWTGESTLRALQLLEALPHGVIAMSQDIPGLVETSTSLATARVQDDSLELVCSTRSSINAALVAVRRRIGAIGALAGAAVEEKAAYPGWKPNLASPLLAVVKAVHRDVTGQEPHLEAVHAGLECGIIGEKVPGTDMVSIGPQIENPHSPDERVRVESVGRFWSVLTGTLQRLPA
jgi:dipeptidase D